MADKDKFRADAGIEIEAGRGPYELPQRQIC